MQGDGLSGVGEEEEDEVHDVPGLPQGVSLGNVPLDDVAQQFLQDLRMALAEIGGEAALIEVGQQGAFAGCLRGEGQIFAIVEREDLK